MRPGSIALVLHAHLPFVRHPEHDEFLEEEWLFEAITETYIPLINMMERLVRDSVPFRLSMSITPPLCAMLNDQLLRDRYVRYLERLIELAGREVARNEADARLLSLSQFYLEIFSGCRHRFVEEWQRDLLRPIRQLRDAGVLAIMASAATHGLLPLLQQSPSAVRAQILIGRDVHRENFGSDPIGFWLPECAYTAGLEPHLQEANLRWFVLDAHGLAFANPRPRRAIYSPCYTRRGLAAFARDRQPSRQIWSAREGYPGDALYRDFYRDLGWDLPIEQLAPVAHPSGFRKFTGIKYHRVTGPELEKELYDPGAANQRAAEHARHFLHQRAEQIGALGAEGFNPIIVIPFDAELFGHWWFEGPTFLESFIRQAASENVNFDLVTPTEYLAQRPTQEVVTPADSSWGENGYWGVWLDESNAWIYPHLHASANRMTALARKFETNADDFADRVLKQLTRELLLAQSSDWAFLMKTGTAREYANKRTRDHILRFNKLHDQFVAGKIEEAFLAHCEWRDNLFPNVNWRYYS